MTLQFESAAAEDVLDGCATVVEDEAAWVCWAAVEVGTALEEGAMMVLVARAAEDVEAEVVVVGAGEEVERAAADEVATGAEEDAAEEELLLATAFEELPLPVSISKL